MATVIIFNSGVVDTKKTNMLCCGTCLDKGFVSFSGLTQPYICDDVRNAITYERPLPAGCAFTRERSERKATRSMRRVAMFDRRTHPGASIDYGVISCERSSKRQRTVLRELCLYAYTCFLYRGVLFLLWNIHSMHIYTETQLMIILHRLRRAQRACSATKHVLDTTCS